MKQEYGASQIQVLEGLEAVRKRPGMYIGSTGPRGLHHLVYEVVDNSIDEALQGYCSEIYVAINKDGSITVKDNGRGIPVEIHPKTGKSTLETVLYSTTCRRKIWWRRIQSIWWSSRSWCFCSKCII